MYFHTEPAGIRRSLEESLLFSKPVGLYAPEVLGSGTFITIVEEISYDAEVISVSLRPFCDTGCILVKSRIFLSDIQKVYSLSPGGRNVRIHTLTGRPFHLITN